MLTQEQRERLKPYETFLHTAYYGGYTTGIFRKDVLAIFEVYNEAREMHLTEANASCNGCVLEACRWLGMHYFAENDKKDVVSAPKSQKVKSTTPKTKTPARGTKRTQNGKK